MSVVGVRRGTNPNEVDELAELKQRRIDHAAKHGTDKTLRLKAENNWYGPRYTPQDAPSDFGRWLDNVSGTFRHKDPVGAMAPMMAAPVYDPQARAGQYWDVIEDYVDEMELLELRRRALARKPSARRTVTPTRRAEYRRQSPAELRRMRAGMDPNSNAYALITRAIARAEGRAGSVIERGTHKAARVGVLPYGR